VWVVGGVETNSNRLLIRARVWGCCFCGCSGELRSYFMPERLPWVTSPPALMMVTSDRL